MWAPAASPAITTAPTSGPRTSGMGPSSAPAACWWPLYASAPARPSAQDRPLTRALRMANSPWSAPSRSRRPGGRGHANSTTKRKQPRSLPRSAEGANSRNPRAKSRNTNGQRDEDSGYRRADIEDVVSAHVLAALKAPVIGFARYIISATSPVTRADLLELRANAPAVLRRYAPSYEAEYRRRDTTSKASWDAW